MIMDGRGRVCHGGRARRGGCAWPAPPPTQRALPAGAVLPPPRARPSLLSRALASVLRQTCADLEVVVVDNNRASPAVRDSAQVAALLADPRVVVIKSAGANTAGAARNEGVAIARGEWITYLDDDDE